MSVFLLTSNRGCVEQYYSGCRWDTEGLVHPIQNEKEGRWPLDTFCKEKRVRKLIDTSREHDIREAILDTPTNSSQTIFSNNKISNLCKENWARKPVDTSREHDLRGVVLETTPNSSRTIFSSQISSRLLLVLILAPRVFFTGTPFFLPPQEPAFLNYNSIWDPRGLGFCKTVLSSLNKVDVSIKALLVIDTCL